MHGAGNSAGIDLSGELIGKIQKNKQGEDLKPYACGSGVRLSSQKKLPPVKKLHLSNLGRLPVRAKERVGHPGFRGEVFTPHGIGGIHQCLDRLSY